MRSLLPTLLVLGLIGCAAPPRQSARAPSGVSHTHYEAYKAAREIDPKVQLAVYHLPLPEAAVPFLRELPLLGHLFGKEEPVRRPPLLGELPILQQLFVDEPATGAPDWVGMLREAFPDVDWDSPYVLRAEGGELLAIHHPDVLDRLDAVQKELFENLPMYTVELALYELDEAPAAGAPLPLEGEPIALPRVVVFANQASHAQLIAQHAYVADFVAVRRHGDTVFDPVIELLSEGYRADVEVVTDAEEPYLALVFEQAELLSMDKLRVDDAIEIDVPEVRKVSVEETLRLSELPTRLAITPRLVLRVDVRSEPLRVRE